MLFGDYVGSIEIAEGAESVEYQFEGVSGYQIYLVDSGDFQ